MLCITQPLITPLQLCWPYRLRSTVVIPSIINNCQTLNQTQSVVSETNSSRPHSFQTFQKIVHIRRILRSALIFLKNTMIVFVVMCMNSVLCMCNVYSIEIQPYD